MITILQIIIKKNPAYDFSSLECLITEHVKYYLGPTLDLHENIIKVLFRPNLIFAAEGFTIPQFHRLKVTS